MTARTDDLSAIPTEAWSRLASAAADPASPFRRMQLGTLGRTGWPEIRTVMLRHADTDARRIVFYTDARSAKVSEIVADGRVSLHLRSDAEEMQLRLWGQAVAQTEGPEIDAAWQALLPRQRAPYQVAVASGRPLRDPAAGDPAPGDSAGGPGAFALVAITVMRLEWLRLHPTGHRRARFDWLDGQWQGSWLAP